MNSRNLLNLALAAVVFALGTLIWFSQQAPPAPEPERLTTLTEADITRIEIRPARHADVVLERRGSEWWLVKPLTARADMARVDAAIGLARARSLAGYATSAMDVQQAGLVSPDLVLRVNDVTLELGGTEPLRGQRFVRLGDRVHLIVDRYSYLLQGGLASLVSPQLLPTGARLQEIVLPGLHLLQRNGLWQLADSEAGSADALQALVDEWRHAHALRVSRRDGDEDGETITLRLAADASPVYFILQRDEDEVLFIRPDLGLAYHFLPAVAERLLALPSVESVTGGDTDA
ncbi:MAG: DUF4340 domain-containing protein [Gammaproteobacteria bacterium]|nr:DUF4340 domain-containing protein [Gammaproteobacteria bacterium]MCF6363020.1 DUF4340 domain-containing protein [Gammaproteobacteria bacterium]